MERLLVGSIGRPLRAAQGDGKLVAFVGFQLFYRQRDRAVPGVVRLLGEGDVADALPFRLQAAVTEEVDAECCAA